jgi:tetratricopeptide (TPR) repeat protein
VTRPPPLVAGALGLLLLLAPLVLTGCGNREQARAEPQDGRLQNAGDAGRQALDLGRLQQALEQYREAFKLAVVRNDAQAIGATGYNLAVVELAGNDPAAALRTATQTRDALAVRGVTKLAPLDLVQAAALHRLGRDVAADAFAARAEAGAEDPAVRARATFVRGLAADASGDTAGVAAALARFGQPKPPPPDWQADRDEIAARLHLLRGENADAASLAQHSADIRRTQLDYRAMAEALALAARAKARAGLTQEAANLYLQAGESAMSRGDKASAGPWLRLASRSGALPATRQAAAKLLADLRGGPAKAGARANPGARQGALPL